MKLFWILLISLGLRLISINQSLWLDEAISANVVKNYSYGEIVKTFSPGDFHPPGYYLMLKTWTGVFGNSTVSVRMPSVIFSLITVYVIYLMAGSWPAILTGLNPLFVYYSQEARMYSMATMLLILAIYSFVKKKYWIYNLLTFLSFVTFYGSVFLLAALALYLLIKKKYKEFLISNIGLILAILVLMPLIRTQMQNSREMLFAVKNWSLVLGRANLKNLLLIPVKFTSGRISFYPKILYYVVSGLWMIYVFGKVVKNSLKNKFFGYIFWVSLIIGIVFSIFTPMLQYFRFLYLVPVMALLIGKNKIIAIGFIAFSLVYLLIPNNWREDWKNLSKNLGDKVYMIQSFADPVKYYKPEIVVQDIKTKPVETTITVIPYGEVIHGVDHTSLLKAGGYKLVREQSYREITSEIWQLTN
jgi:uncharacterized membrane protein